MAKEERQEVKAELQRYKMIKTVAVSAVIAVVAIIALIIVIVVTNTIKAKNAAEPEEPTVTVSMIEQQVQSCSELTTAELKFRGVLTFEKGDIPIINKNSFFMIYEADVQAGVDLAKAEISMTDTEVIVKLPQVEIQSIDVDPESIEFYDNQTSIFNPSGKEDAVTAMEYAVDDVKVHADLGELKERAKKETSSIISGVLSPTLDGRTLRIEYEEEEPTTADELTE